MKNVPASFISKFGKTTGCGICANSKGSFHGKVHHKVCIDRYVKWLKEQELKGVRDLPSAQVQPVGRTPDAEHPVRLTGKQPRPEALHEPLTPVATRFGPPPWSKDHEMLVEGGEGGHDHETKRDGSALRAVDCASPPCPLDGIGGEISTRNKEPSYNPNLKGSGT